MKLISFQNLIRRYFSGESFIIFDTETTGLNTYHDEIVEIAGVIWQKNGPGMAFQELIRVNPNKITPGAWERHKIPLEDLAKARGPQEVFKDFIEFCGGRPLIAHNIRFDYDMLNYNLIRHGFIPYPNNEVVCSLAYAREQAMPGKLSDLAHHWKVTLEGQTWHRALYDAQVLMGILNKMMQKHEPKEMQYSLIF